MEIDNTINVLDAGFVKYKGHFGDDGMIPRIARVSTGSENKGDEQDAKLLGYLYKNFHSSPFEFANITYLLKCPLFVRDQIVRHRTAKVNIMSLRYQEAKDEFYFPAKWRLQDDKNRQGSNETDKEIILDTAQWNDDYHRGGDKTDIDFALGDASQHAYHTYEKMIEQGVAKEMARMVLGTNLYTYMYIQFDLNNLIKFFRLRSHPHAQWEVRQYSDAMYLMFKELFPVCADCYEKYKMELKTEV